MRYSIHGIYMPNYLSAFLCTIEQNATVENIKYLRTLLAQCTKVAKQKPQAFLDVLFINAMLRRFESEKEVHGHLYLENFEIPQIVLFEVLINKFPLVNLGHSIVNDAIAHVVARGKNSVLIDFGIGRGVQTARLIKAMASHSSLETLTIIGVEPFHQALIHARQLIFEAAEHSPFKVVFIPMECLAEKLELEALRAALPSRFEKVAVNASLTAHHIPSVAGRIAFFEIIRRLQPDAFLLTEPDSDHMEPRWRQRVENAYMHYGAVFSLIDELDIGKTEKDALKAFFGREIEDVISLPDDQRFERHEPAPCWIEHLAKAGLQICRPARPANFWHAPGVSCCEEKEGYLSLCHKGIKILSILQCR